MGLEVAVGNEVRLDIHQCVEVSLVVTIVQSVGKSNLESHIITLYRCAGFGDR